MSAAPLSQGAELVEFLRSSLPRLGRIAGADAGVFVLSVHSVVESYCRRRFADFGDHRRFHHLLEDLRQELKARSRRFLPEWYVFANLTQEHFLTNAVRHRFDALGEAEAKAAAVNLLLFLKVIGHDGIAGGVFDELLAPWKSGRFEATDAGGPSSRGAGEVSRPSVSSASPTGASEGGLEARFRREEERRKRLLALDPRARERIERLRRMTVLTRTRRDFEKSLGEWSPEQRRALALLPGEGFTLLRGGPGSGKSMLLLESLSASAGPATYLCFSEPLLRHARERIRRRGVEDKVDPLTVDECLLRMGRKAGLLDGGFDRSVLDADSLASCAGLGMSAPELARKVEHDHWGVAGEPDRKSRVAAFAEATLARMVRTRRFSRHGLARALLALAPDSALEVLYVDEAQDLSPVVLALLARSATRALVLAGDENQAVYRERPPWDFLDSLRVLELPSSWRTTRPLWRFAEKLRTGEEPGEPLPPRDGPIPHLHRLSPADPPLDRVAEEVRFHLDDLGYEPGNVLVIGPSRESNLRLREILLPWVEAVEITDPSFDFASGDRVVLATFGSCKGVETPCAIVLLDEEGEGPAGRIYTALTRAHESLSVVARVGRTKRVDEVVSCYDSLWPLEAPEARP